MKKRIIVVLAVVVLMTIGCLQTEKQEEGHSSMVTTSDNEAVLAYRNGEDVTEERKLLEEQTKDSIGCTNKSLVILRLYKPLSRMKTCNFILHNNVFA